MIESSLHQADTMSIPGRGFLRVARSVAGYAVATALMLITPLLVFAPASLFHCAMRNSRAAAWTAAVVASGLAGIYFSQVASASAGSQVKLVYSSFIGIVLAVVVPSMVAIPLVDQKRKFGIVLTVALVCSSIGLGATELIMRAFSFSPYAAQLADATALANKMAYMNRALESQPGGRLALWLLTHSPVVLPAMILLDVALVFILSLMMFGRLSAWRAFATTHTADPAARDTYLFRDLQLPEWLLFLFVLGGLTPLLTGIWQVTAANVLAIMLCLYLLQGLAIFRAILVRAEAGIAASVLAFFILGMLCLTGIGLVLLVGVGLFDPFFDFRKLNRKDDSHESHTD